MFFLNSLSASWLVRELSSPRLDWPRVGLSASCPVTVVTSVMEYSQLVTRSTRHWQISEELQYLDI